MPARARSRSAPRTGPLLKSMMSPNSRSDACRCSSMTSASSRVCSSVNGMPACSRTDSTLALISSSGLDVTTCAAAGATSARRPKTKFIERTANCSAQPRRRRPRFATLVRELAADAARPTRNMAGSHVLGDLHRDVRDAVRSLARRPAFTAVALLSLAIGIGANTATFSLVNAIVLRETPIAHPEQVVYIYLHQADFAYSTLSYPELRDLRDGADDAFADIGSTQIIPAQVDGEDGIG